MELTIAVPMYNEAAIARETVRRLLEAGERTGLRFEVLGVNDGSDDGTTEVLAELAGGDLRVRHVRLARNSGHFVATRAGLGDARGAMIVVLDADLQTPPELIPELVAALRQSPDDTAAVFGVTSKRDDPAVLLVGQAVFFFLQAALSRHAIPHGASSFFIIRRRVARQIAALPLRSGNVGAVVAALGLKAGTVTYDKPASYREDSRLGLKGHLREAIGSLALTGVLSRLALAGTLVCLLAAAVAWMGSHSLVWPAAGIVLAALSAMAASTADRFVRRSLLPGSGVPLRLVRPAAATEIDDVRQ